METAWLAAITYLGISAGLVLVWRRYRPDFDMRYGGHSTVFLMLFIVFPPALVVAHLLERKADASVNRQKPEQQ